MISHNLLFGTKPAIFWAMLQLSRKRYAFHRDGDLLALGGALEHSREIATLLGK